jgi:diguanylate cyclase (GGDEF)-like protein
MEETLAMLAEGQDTAAADLFETVPIPLWLEDYSGVESLFARWRAEGVADLRAFLLEQPERVRSCSEQLRVLKVNQHVLSLYGARDLAHLCDNLGSVFRDDMYHSFVEELVQLWQGSPGFNSNAVNYTLSGRRLDIQLKGRIVPGFEQSWQRVLVATEDVTEREQARRLLALSERHARGLFEHSPVSLWVEDFSRIKELLDGLRARGIVDFRVFTDVHPEFVERCMSEIRVIDVNQQTLDLYKAPDRNTLVSRLSEVFRDDMAQNFREQLIDLWNGKLFQTREVVNYTLGGDELYLHMQFSVLPGFEQDWSHVQVAIADITARKKAEAYLEYLGSHDVLTTLHNRSFYADEMNRLERKGPWPVTIIMLDLNNLKQANDQWGHGAGDALLRRVGEVLGEAVDKPHQAARVGGDEFAILMPASGPEQGQAMVDSILKLLDINNQFYSTAPLSLAFGMATAQRGERLEYAAQRADLLMYEAKRAHHKQQLMMQEQPSSRSTLN